MKVLITGIDGYLGWSLAQNLTTNGHEVGGVDAFFRRNWVEEMGSYSAIPIPSMKKRIIEFKKQYDKELNFWKIDLRNFAKVKSVISKFRPDAIIHLGECPSAPYSMIDVYHANFVQSNNIMTTFNVLFSIKEVSPKVPLIKLGTMGEYGTPNVRIPEGFFEITYRGRRDRLPFPRQANSWYHWSKVHGSNNLMFASKLWNLRVIDIMQGIVYGLNTENIENNKKLSTRLDFDNAFGTIVNRFCCQSIIEHPLTICGRGDQRRGFISLKDSMHCLNLVLEESVSSEGYRVFNQFDEIYSLNEIASKVQHEANKFGVRVDKMKVKNLRKEKEEHYFKPDRKNLLALGYKGSGMMSTEINKIIVNLLLHKNRIRHKKEVLLPKIDWT